MPRLKTNKCQKDLVKKQQKNHWLQLQQQKNFQRSLIQRIQMILKQCLTHQQKCQNYTMKRKLRLTAI